MSVWRHPQLLAVSIGHLTIDSFNSMGPVLLAALSIPMGLSNAQVGLALTLYTLIASLLQPLFGWLGDRFHLRWIIGGSIVWTCAWLALASQTRSFAILLVPFLLAALGSAAFHPAATTQATLVGRGTQAATAASIFFLFGQIGLAAGPILGGAILQFVGTIGIPVLLIFIVPVAIAVLRQSRRDTVETKSPGEKVAAAASPVQTATATWTTHAYLIAGAFVIMVFLRSAGQHGISSFLPLFYAQQGLTSLQYGLMTGSFIFASAWGGVVGGWASDRWSQKGVLVGSMLLGVIPALIFPMLSGVQALPFLAMAGFLMGASHSVLVVMAQRMFPGGMALASGLVLGFMFASGGVGTFLAGYLGDIIGLATTLQGLALLLALSAVFALALPRRSSQTGAAVLQSQMT